MGWAKTQRCETGNGVPMDRITCVFFRFFPTLGFLGEGSSRVSSGGGGRRIHFRL